MFWIFLILITYFGHYMTSRELEELKQKIERPKETIIKKPIIIPITKDAKTNYTCIIVGLLIIIAVLLCKLA